MLFVVAMVTSTYDLASSASAAHRTRPPESQSTKPAPKELIAQMPAGVILEVRLLNKKKWTGQLGKVSTESFELQMKKNGKAIIESIAFKDVKSVKQLDQTKMSTTGKIVYGVLAGLVVLIILAVEAVSR
jgi:hypothetical protein